MIDIYAFALDQTGLYEMKYLANHTGYVQLAKISTSVCTLVFSAFVKI